MKLKISTCIICLCFSFISCNTSSEYFIGKWQILTVVENNTVIELTENWMHLKSNGIFESYDGGLKKNESGTWSYQLENKILAIDGEGKAGDSQWKLSMKNDTLIFQATADDLYLTAVKMQ